MEPGWPRWYAALAFLFFAWPAIVAAEDQDCPFAGKRPPLDEILKLPLAQRPSLCKANLEEANLAGADLSGLGLTEANLVRANLAGALLVRADLTGAKLWGANLTGVAKAGHGA